MTHLLHLPLTWCCKRAELQQQSDKVSRLLTGVSTTEKNWEDPRLSDNMTNPANSADSTAGKAGIPAAVRLCQLVDMGYIQLPK